MSNATVAPLRHATQNRRQQVALLGPLQPAIGEVDARREVPDRAAAARCTAATAPFPPQSGRAVCGAPLRSSSAAGMNHARIRPRHREMSGWVCASVLSKTFSPACRTPKVSTSARSSSSGPTMTALFPAATQARSAAASSVE